MHTFRRVRTRFWLVGMVSALVLGTAGVLAVPWLCGGALCVQSVNTAANLDPQFGVEPGWSLTNLTSAQLTSRLAGVKKLGVTWVRFDVDWAVVQPNGPASYNWTAYDRVAAAIKVAGLKGLGVIDYSPAWAQSSGPRGTQTPPANDAQYAAFAGAVAGRYAPQGLHAWEIWNEPNWTDFWPSAPNPAAYTALLKQAYVAIHKANPYAAVIAAGLSGTGSSGDDIAATTFLNGMYAAGAKGYFEAIAMHPYTFPLLASDAMAGSWQELPALHKIMEKNGDGWKKIWITEYGAPTSGAGIGAAEAGTQDDRGGVDHVSESAQADIVTAAVKAYESLSYAGPFFWYDYQDSSAVGPSQPNAEMSYGLVRADGTPKPAYAAYQKAIAAAK
ncbi:MAG TPA: cellulase family glycosylhydrolase [Candidatus Saccharimonadales bacterium]